MRWVPLSRVGCPYLEPNQGKARSLKKPPASHDCSLVVTERATLEDKNNGYCGCAVGPSWKGELKLCSTAEGTSGRRCKNVRVSRRADGGTGGASSSLIVMERALTSSSIKWSPALLAHARACPSTWSWLQSHATTAPGLGSPEAFTHPALVPSGRQISKAARSLTRGRNEDESEGGGDWEKFE